MKNMKKLISLLAFTMCLSFSTNTYALSLDTSKHWAKNDIDYLEREHIMFSINNRFRPDDFITRAEFMSAINNNFNFSKKVNINFRDAYPNSWYYEDIMKAVAAGYINGYDDGTIKPNGHLTREEAAKIIALASGFENEVPEGIHHFNDINKMSSWAIIYINLLNEKGFMNGFEDGSFKPKKLITRGETASIIANIRRSQLANSKTKPGDFISYGYSLQVGSFSSFSSAKSLKDQLLAYGFEDIFIVQFPNTSSYSVLASCLLSFEDASILKDRLQAFNIDSYITDKKFRYSDILKDSTDLGINPNVFNKEDRPSSDINKGKPNSGSLVPPLKTLSVQAGTFTSIDGAVELRNNLISFGFEDTFILKFKNSNTYFVLVKSGLSKAEAEALRLELEKLNFDSFVTNKNIKEGIII